MKHVKMAGGKRSISNSPKNQGETGIFAKGDVEMKNRGEQN